MCSIPSTKQLMSGAGGLPECSHMSVEHSMITGVRSWIVACLTNAAHQAIEKGLRMPRTVFVDFASYQIDQVFMHSALEQLQCCPEYSQSEYDAVANAIIVVREISEEEISSHALAFVAA